MKGKRFSTEEKIRILREAQFRSFREFSHTMREVGKVIGLPDDGLDRYSSVYL